MHMSRCGPRVLYRLGWLALATGFCFAQNFQEFGTPGFSPYSIAAAFAYQGDAEHVMSYLQKAADVHEPRLMTLKVDSVFEGFSRDLRLVALERKLGLID